MFQYYLTQLWLYSLGWILGLWIGCTWTLWKSWFVCEREERRREEGRWREHDDPHLMRAKNPVDGHHCFRPTVSANLLKLGFHRFLCKVPSSVPWGEGVYKGVSLFSSSAQFPNCLKYFLSSKHQKRPIVLPLLIPLPNPSWPRRGLNTAFPSTLRRGLLN